jgi:hypothetical protein
LNRWLSGAAMKLLSSLQSAKIGGRDRDRTCDLMLAKHALSQLSYTPPQLYDSNNESNRISRQ